jgi:starch-binding outer membrane protein, SusD/RagB family
MKKILIIVLMVSLGMSCTEQFLEETDPARYTEFNYLDQYANGPEALTNAVYSTLNAIVGMESGGPLIWFDEGRGDDIVRQLEYMDSEYHAFILFNWTEDFARVEQGWRFLYQGIFRANYAIFKLTQEDEVKYRRYIGEATLLRGYYYFNLARWYGSVPIIKEYTGETDFFPVQSPEEEVWAQAETDLTKALELLSDALPTPGQFNGRVDKGVALALLAKLHLYQARPQDGSAHWQKVVDYCQQVKDLGIYSLESDFIDVFDMERYYNNQSNEFIFMVSWAYGQDNAGNPAPGQYFNRITRHLSPYNSGRRYYLNYWIDPTTGAINLGRENRGAVCMSPEVFQLFDQSREQGDTRYHGSVLYPTFLSYNPDSAAVGVIHADTINMVERGIEPCIYKYRADGLSWNHRQYNAVHPWSIIRYADILLMLAEAQNEIAGAPTAPAYENINAVRERAKVAPLAGLDYVSFRNAVWDERRLEFLFEGQRVPDLIRTNRYEFGTFTPPDPGANPFAEKFKVIPVPARELRVNPNLVQHPLWR